MRDLEHSHVVKIFQNSDKVNLVILPAKFKSVSDISDLVCVSMFVCG